MHNHLGSHAFSINAHTVLRLSWNHKYTTAKTEKFTPCRLLGTKKMSECLLFRLLRFPRNNKPNMVGSLWNNHIWKLKYCLNTKIYPHTLHFCCSKRDFGSILIMTIKQNWEKWNTFLSSIFYFLLPNHSLELPGNVSASKTGNTLKIFLPLKLVKNLGKEEE